MKFEKLGNNKHTRIYILWIHTNWRCRKLLIHSVHIKIHTHTKRIHSHMIICIYTHKQTHPRECQINNITLRALVKSFHAQSIHRCTYCTNMHKYRYVRELLRNLIIAHYEHNKLTCFHNLVCARIQSKHMMHANIYTATRHNRKERKWLCGKKENDCVCGQACTLHTMDALG